MQKKTPKNISNEDNQKKKPNLSISFSFYDKKPISQYIFFPMIISEIMKWFM